MKTNKINLNVDKIEITYYLTHEIIDLLNGEQEIDFNDFKLIRNNEDSNFAINYDIMIPNYECDAFYKKFGNIYFGSNRHFKNQIYVSIYNPLLYTYDEKHYIYAITETIGLEFMEINYIEIAVDTNVNLISKYGKLMKNEDYTPIILNKKIKDMNKEITAIKNIYTGTRKNPNKYKSVYFTNKEGGLTLNIYDKKKEIKDNANTKNYIINDGEFSKSDKVIRYEIRALNHIIKDTLNKSGYRQEDLYYQLFNDDFITNIFKDLSDRIIRIEDNKKNVYNLLYLLLD